MMCLKAQAAVILAGLMVLSARGEGVPGAQLVWSAEQLETNATFTQGTAEFSFGVTNISDYEVVINDAKGSCSCTTAQLPSKPWHLPTHGSGQVKVSVDLRGKMGTFEKTVSIIGAGTTMPLKVLRVMVKMPDRRMFREENTKIAQADRQAVFKGECAKCHAEPAKTATGHALYRQVCGICHDAHPRASTVPDLHLINHPTDYEFWRTAIANGKTGTMMPAFASGQGGPFTDAQIDELARDCLKTMPYIPRTRAELNAEQSGRPAQAGRRGTTN